MTEVLSGAHQTVVDESTDEWRWCLVLMSMQQDVILNIHYIIECATSYINIFMLNG